jgi:hypothetical protein
MKFDYKKYAAWKQDRVRKIARLNDQWGIEGELAFMFISDTLECNGNKPVKMKHNPDFKHLWRPDITKKFLSDCIRYELLCTDGDNIWLAADIVNPYSKGQ